ncbi:MAG: hypothetical protein CME06_12020 [Gemmatimonadetes bacterium]|nr:hypothetical protein [Gemmatimonadota bacterium]
MTRRNNQRIVEHWLAAESAGSEEEADHLFRGVLRGLPNPVPAGRFVEQVMAAVVAGTRPILSRRWAKGSILFGLIRILDQGGDQR